jgi:hypothetical protein
VSDNLNEAELALEYRRHAEAIRAAAKFGRTPANREVLRRIAADYDLMADALEGLNLTNESVRKRWRTA